MAKLWKWSMLFFLIIGLLMHKEDYMMNAIMETPYTVFDIVFTIGLSGCLWGGFLHIIEKTGFMNYFSFFLKPLLYFMYGKIIEKQDVYDDLSSNFIANLLGLGTLATLSGIKAFQRLHEYHMEKTYPSREMMTLVIVNTAGFCLFPSSLIMLRKQFESQDIYAFYPYMLIISLSIIIIGLLIQKVIDHE